EAQAAEEAAQAEAEAQAAEEAAQAEAEAQAAEEAAQAEAEAQAAEEAAQAEAEAQAAEEAAQAEAEAQAAEEAAQAEAEAQAAEEAAEAEAEAQAAEAEVETAEDDTPGELALIDPTTADEDEAPVAATAEAPAPEDVIEETLDAQSVRTSAQDFTTAIGSAATSQTPRSGLSNLETALLLGLGAVVVGSVLRNGDRVVANTGDRVVVEGPRGFTVYKDDDALLRQPGATMRTETFSDGSSRTFVDRADGSQIETIRDSRGRVLRRAVVYPDGTQYELFDDLEPAQVVDVRQLHATRAAPRSFSMSDSDLAALRVAMRDEMAFDPGRTFSLRQIREIEQVRSLVPAIELDTITFATGSAAIPAAQARSLVRLGILIEEMLFENPREVFLIEGHTDAVGSASNNLALSDRRAESVALALTESFRIPAENLIVQGYGEAFLKIDTQAAEERNRRATVRRITPLLRQIAAN
ncbi:OmpA family protein, partial [Roseinatronobacter sp.]|uniref:OmpA family protein n=1 Tax=Roseinatronobacter sp. TaxID=1945755 RepID=UPI0025E4355C